MLNGAFEVRRHDFQEAKANIKIFSERRIDSPKFESVATETLYGLMSRSVTGSELNERISKIQHHFIKINEQLNEIKGQFGNVYETFESLDKDYIEGIVASIGATKIVSDQALAASYQAQKASEQSLEAAEEAKKICNDVKRSLQIHVAIIDNLEKEKNRSESRFATTQNEIDQVKDTVGQRYEMLGKLIVSQSNSLTEIRKRQENRNDEFISQIERIRNETIENEQRYRDKYLEQSAVISKKLRKTYILLGVFGVAATVNLILTIIRAI